MRCLRLFCLVIPIVPLFMTLGCGESGPPKAVVSGKIHNAGKPLEVKQMVGHLGLRFMDASGKDRVPYDAVIAPDGTFKVNGNTGTGIVAGKYKISIRWSDDGPVGADKLKGKFSEQTTKIIRDVPSPTPIDIDVSKPEG